MNTPRLSFFLPLVFCLAACGGGGGSTAPAPTQPPPSVNGTVSGLVTDQSGRPLPNVGVKVGAGATAKTVASNEQGFFAVSAIPPGQQLINATLTGFVENTKRVEVRASNNSQVGVVLQAVGTTQTIDARQPNTVVHRGGNVVLPANGIVDAQGRLVSSAVVQLTTMMPEDPNFGSAMPSEFEGIDAGVSTRLVSYGVLDVVLRDANGNPLQLAAGRTAELSFPIPANDPVDATVPLWSTDPSTSVWTREGSATRDAAAGVYRGTVSHFTPWNLDQGRAVGTKRVRLKVRGQAVIGVTVRAVGNGWVAGGITDINGQVDLPVTANVPSLFESRADIMVLLSSGAWQVLRSSETMPGIGEVLVNDFTEADGVVQVAGTIILRWSEKPSDLDTHLTIPTPTQRFHLFYGNPGRTNETPFSALDTDDVTSFGPEITTISRPFAGTYRYCVHNFSGNGQHPISDSGASVTLILANQPTRVYTVPTQNPANHAFWAVFDLTYDAAGNATVVDVNQFGGIEVLNR